MTGPEMLLAAAFAQIACVPVEADRISARDVAGALPSFSNAPPDAFIGYAPNPGAIRVFKVPEMRRLAARYGADENILTEICFQRAMETLTPERIARAMESSAPVPNAKIEVRRFLHSPVPKGELIFPLSGIFTAEKSGATVTWRGYVTYARTRRFPVWATAVITALQDQVVAVAPLSPGKAIEAAQVRLENRCCSLSPAGNATSLEQVVGKTPRRRIAAGSPIRADQLDAMKEIERGDIVRVTVRNGATRLGVDARAESAGALGDTIAVRNLVSGKVFRARVEGKGVAVVLLAAGAGEAEARR